MPDTLVHVFKEYINKGDIEGFKNYMTELETEYEGIPWDYVFQKVYVHACLKKNKVIAEFMTEKFNDLEPIQKIAVRQVFSYGKYLLNK